MNDKEKRFARILFENKIRKSDGNAFEDLFTQIMRYSEAEFEQIKPWGNIGDRKNDGFIRSKGIYYQVFAPEEISESYPDAIKKLKNDFKGLKENWSPINEFYFVVNDKYKGVNADSNNTIAKIVEDYKLKKGQILTANSLEKTLFQCKDDEIINVVGYLPDLDQITNLKYSELDEVIGYIMRLPSRPHKEKLIVPNWDKKIVFNGLGARVKSFLDIASINLGELDDFFNYQDFLAETVPIKLVALYEDYKKTKSGDELFWDIVYNCMPKDESAYLTATITIMAKYFECCDIFEEPIE